MKTPVLVLTDLVPQYVSYLEGHGFQLHMAPTPASRAALHPVLAVVRAVITNGSNGISAADIAALPNLEIICVVGVGYERVDIAAAEARGIIVTNCPCINDASVADHALALLLGITRAIPEADAAVRRGEWALFRQLRPTISGKRLGILGLGHIGMQIAGRAVGGFDMQIAYHNRRQRDDVPYLYCSTPTALAEWANYLVIATPGGKSTTHMVSSAVLTALGPTGFLINVARGTVVDTAALVEALRKQHIAGAALDVVEGEPAVPPDLLRLPNLILTPHLGGRTLEAITASVLLVHENLCAHFAGRPVKTPIKSG